MKKLLPVLAVMLIFCSCTKDGYIEDSHENNKIENGVQLSEEQKSVEIFNQFLEDIDKNETSTKAIATPKIIKINKTSSTAYGNSQAINTKALEAGMPIYELTLGNDDDTKGFAVVAVDPIFSEVIAYAPVGSISDTTNIGAMAYYFRALSEYLTAIKEEGTNNDYPATKAEYWQPRINGGYREIPNSTEVVAKYASRQAFDNAGGLFYRADPYDATDTWSNGIVAAKWCQEAPYNDKVPVFLPGTSTRCRIGCGPISIGQIMSFHKKPTTYDWATITSSPVISIYAPAATKDKVSTLLINIAEKAQTWWDVNQNFGNTNAYMILPTLQYFGYNATLIESGSTISAIIYDDLMLGRPCLLAGIANPDAHIWVVDGLYREYRWYYYSSLTTNGGPDPVTSFIDAGLYRRRERYSMLHCNWGWGDDSNGWYASMTPYYSRYGRNADFNGTFMLWHNISPK